MSIKIEIGLVLGTILGALAVLSVKQPFAAEAQTERTTVFAKADYTAFDRDFKLKDDTCAVGLAKRKLCFAPSPLQDHITKGSYLPTSVPILAAEFPIIAALPVKTEAQQLLRYGTVLALIDEDTRMIEDILHIDADSFTEAQATFPTELVETIDTQAAG